MAKLTYEHAGKTYVLQLEALGDQQYRAVIDDQVYVVTAAPIDAHSWLITHDDQQQAVSVAIEGKTRYVQVAGTEPVTLKLPETARRRSAQSDGEARLTAQMPGQVVEVYVTDGEEIAAGQTLLVLEAMKMEIRISAPADGVIKQVLVKKGDVVARDQVLIAL